VEAIVDVGGNIRAEWVDFAKNAGVKYLQAQTNGLDHVEVDKIRDSGMMLAHCPGELSSVALAEGAMMFILMLAHRHGDAQRNFAAGKVFFPMGMELVDRRLGIVGFGASGQQLARRAKAFGMRILAVDVRPIEPEVLDEIQPDFLGGPDDLDRVMAESDFISVHVHLTAKTRHIINARRIKLMKPTACIINVARGELIDEEALYCALLDGRIGGAGLDAFAQEPPDTTLPVYQLPNVCVTPHTVGSTDGTSRKRALFAAENLDRYARGEAVLARVF
jgi:phosphoglycerate dehydrogenase-like enzyme